MMEQRRVTGFLRLSACISGLLIVMCGAWVGSPAAAQAPKRGDPCLDAAVAPDQSKRSGVHVNHDVAIFMVKHTQRACRSIDRWLHNGSTMIGSPRGVALRGLTAKLESDVLLPIYGEYPEIRGRDMTEAAVKLPNLRCPATDLGRTRGPAAIDRATAVRLRKTLADVEGALVFVPKDSPLRCGKTEAADCAQPILDILQEMSFAASPIYGAYPDLWKLESQELSRRNPMPARTAASDAEFRAGKSAAGPLHLTPAALGFLRSFDDDVRQDDEGCQAVTLFWAKAVTFKGPDDADWRSLPPGISAGGFWCADVPPDALQTVDGLEIAITGPDAARFSGKTIDLKTGRLVLTDH